MQKKIFGITIFITTIITSVIILSLFDTTFTQTKNKKKLYIHNLKSEGVNIKISKRIKEGINLSILSSFGNAYHIVDEDTIKVMYKQAEAIMSSGCTDESCVEQIAEGINADEIIFGTVSAEGGKINLLIKSMYRSGDKMGLHSQVNINFYETQIDHFAAETGKKLINPNYVMNMNAPLIADEHILLKALDVEQVKGLDIGILKFQSRDDIIGQMLDYLKDEVKKGDAAFQKNKFNNAIEEYSYVLKKIRTKLLQAQQQKMTEFIAGVKKRIGTAYAMMYRAKVEALDNKVKSKGTGDDRTARNLRNEYGDILTSMQQVRAEYKAVLSQLENSIIQRQDTLTEAIVALYEKRGDIAYREYRFDDALLQYENGKKGIENFNSQSIKQQNLTRMNGKIITTETTGRSYVASKIQSLLDIASYHNLKDEKSKAKAALEKARDILDNSKLVQSEIENKYEEFAALIGGNKLQKTKKRELEFVIGQRGPAGGWVFYDKGYYSDGWRYLEAAPLDLTLNFDLSGEIVWSTEYVAIDTGLKVGTGKSNTQKILVFYKSHGAVKLCDDFSYGGKNDWFLPSKDELFLMYTNLHKKGVSNFEQSQYWSSSRLEKHYIWRLNFFNGYDDYTSYDNRHRVRPIRAF